MQSVCYSVKTMRGSGGDNFERSFREPTSSLMTFDVLSNTISAGTKMVRAVGNNGFTVNDLSVNGGIMLVNNSLLLWDTLQYGVGSKELVETPPSTATNKEVVDDPSSVFHNWTTEEFKLFETVQPLPEILVVGTGAKMHRLPPTLKKYILSLGMQLE
ncbi:hypothetical protein HDU67_005653, partial [Dinochytrium kinnereticum]